MTNQVNFNRIKLLLNKYFLENKQSEYTWWLIIFVFSMFVNNGLSVIIIFISGIRYASNSFKVFSQTSTGMNFISLPASTAEKIINEILINTVYVLLMLILCNVSSILIIDIFNSLTSNKLDQVDTLTMQPTISKLADYFKTLGELLIPFALTQSYFTFGSIYFKNNTTLKSIVVLIIGGFISMQIQLIFQYFKYNELRDTFLVLNSYELVDISSKVSYLLQIILIPYFWLITFHLLKEKEIK